MRYICYHKFKFQTTTKLKHNLRRSGRDRSAILKHSEYCSSNISSKTRALVFLPSFDRLLLRELELSHPTSKI